MRRAEWLVILGGALLLATRTMPAAASDAERKCEAGKYRCTAAVAPKVLRCTAKEWKKPSAGVELEKCLADVQSKFLGGASPEKSCFEKLERKGEAQDSAVPCVSYDDDAIVISVAEHHLGRAPA